METAIVGIIGAFIGILLTNALRIVLDLRNRRERVRDIQTALRAEIRSQRGWLEDFRAESNVKQLLAQIRAGTDFTPFIPAEVRDFVFDGVLKEVHILPGEVIDPIVLYYRQYRGISAFADDLRTDRYSRLEPGRKAAMYEDYIGMGLYGLELSEKALNAINRSLKEGEPN